MNMIASLVPRRACSEAEWKQRVDLAACYRLAERHRMGKVVWKHITARVADALETILVFQLGCRYDEVTASNLLKMSLDGHAIDGAADALNTAAYVIHGGI